MINPLAISVTFGGLLLDILVPRPKPQVGVANEPLPSASLHRLEDTFAHPIERHEHPLFASGTSH